MPDSISTGSRYERRNGNGQANEVLVASAEVSSPLGRPHQVGIICRGDHDITVDKFSVEPTKPKAFVVTKFGEKYDEVYHHVVEEVCSEHGQIPR